MCSFEDAIYLYGINKLKNKTPYHASNIQFVFNQFYEDHKYMSGWITLHISIDNLFESTISLSRVYDPFSDILDFFNDVCVQNQGFLSIDEEGKDAIFLVTPYDQQIRLVVCRNLDEYSIEDNEDINIEIDIMIDKMVLIKSFYESFALFIQNDFNLDAWLMPPYDDNGRGEYFRIELLLEKLHEMVEI